MLPWYCIGKYWLNNGNNFKISQNGKKKWALVGYNHINHLAHYRHPSVSEDNGFYQLELKNNNK